MNNRELTAIFSTRALFLLLYDNEAVLRYVAWGKRRYKSMTMTSFDITALPN
jgi:hypothetical protein